MASYRVSDRRTYTVELRFIRSTPDQIINAVVSAANSSPFSDFTVSRLGLFPMKVSRVDSEKYRKVFIALHRVEPIGSVKTASIAPALGIAAGAVGLVVVTVLGYVLWRGMKSIFLSKFVAHLNAVIVKSEQDGETAEVTVERIKQELVRTGVPVEGEGDGGMVIPGIPLKLDTGFLVAVGAAALAFALINRR